MDISQTEMMRVVAVVRLQVCGLRRVIRIDDVAIFAHTRGPQLPSRKSQRAILPCSNYYPLARSDLKHNE